jgi:hypothetical protein
MTDWGAHHMDIGYWAVGLPAPTKIESKALTEPVPNGYTAISHYEVKFTYPNDLIFNVRAPPDDSPFGAVINPAGQRKGIRFEGSEGWIWVNRDEIKVNDPRAAEQAARRRCRASLLQQRPHGEFLRMHADAQGSDLRCRGRPPLGHRLPSGCDLAADQAQSDVGS